jgi:Flp pilus assembly protein TadD
MPGLSLRVLPTVVLPLLAGGGVLILGGTNAWPPWVAVLAIAGISGAMELRKNHGVARSCKDSAAPAGTPMYAMQQAHRIVPAQGMPAEAPYVAEVSTRTQHALVVAPGTDVGPEALWIPASGHNVTLTFKAAESGALTVLRIAAEVVARMPLPESVGVSSAMPRMPGLVLSPDLLESVQRSVAAYRPLQVPDAAVLLDSEGVDIAMLREVIPPPFDVPPRQTVTLVFAPVTRARACVRWRMVCDIKCMDRVDTIYWDFVVTAHTAMAEFRPGDDGPTPTPAYKLHRDHWDPDNKGRSEGASLPLASPFSVVAHRSADGKKFLLKPSRLGPERESAAAAALREEGDVHAEGQRLDLAIDSYKRAAAAGSGNAAFALGSLLHHQGDLVGAQRWLQEATRKRIFPAFNDLGAVAWRLGEVEQAEVWFRRAMDEGDWTAAVNLAALLVTRGELAEAELILRQADTAQVPSAADTLSRMLVDQGRLDDAEEVLVRDAMGSDRGWFDREAQHDRIFRLSRFLLNHRRDVAKALDLIRGVVDSKVTPPEALAEAALTLDRLTADLTDRAEPALAVAVQANLLRVATHRRLFAMDPKAGFAAYNTAIEGLIGVSAAVGDAENLRLAEKELAGLRRSLRRED